MSETAQTTQTTRKAARYGMVVDLDKCTGCGACMVACAVENNVAPAAPGADDRTGITWMRVYEMRNGADYPASRSIFVPMPCQQCDHPPCESVCPQKAVEYDKDTGIVGQIPVRCLGCRYCMVACPYHARAFNWWDPSWPEGMEATLNPDVSTRMRGVVEKCNFCHHRLQAARARAAPEGRDTVRADEYLPACVEACPVGAITFGDLADPASAVSVQSKAEGGFRFLEKLGTAPKITYRSRQAWVQEMGQRGAPPPAEEVTHG
jgi:molybdopterin-containing oxidoreductase family iron-sulfur binding subunit